MQLILMNLQFTAPLLLCRFSVLFLSFFCSVIPLGRSGDAESLLALKVSLDPSNVLQWGSPEMGGDVCRWQGVKECLNGRVTKLVVENLNLTGALFDGSRSLNELDQLRVLSFKGNSISGPIPSFSGLANLKSVYLNNNNFSGDFPASFAALHRLKIIVLAGNRLSGRIPGALLNLTRLYVLYLQDNQFSGVIPPLNQTSLRFFNISNNNFSGEVPATPALSQFNYSSFSGNPHLCGGVIQKPCEKSHSPRPQPHTVFSPPISPSISVNPATKPSHGRRKKKLILITILSSVGGFLLLSLIIVILLMSSRSRQEVVGSGDKAAVERGGGEREVGTTRGGNGGNNGEKQGGFSWDEGGDGVGALVFVGGGDDEQQMMMMSYTLEELLKASAETLGRGIMGSTYKAVMESGYIVTVKRLKEARYPRLEEFRRHVEILGRLRHPNLVPLRAYFQAKEERLIVYDYFPNGSLFSLIHGSRASGGSKPLHWTSCLKIAEDLATGLLYIHQNPGLTHGNLKSSNVLLGPDFESCLTDYSLTPFRNPELHEESSASSLFYRAPECRDVRRAQTQQADVYSFGVLLLELLTGKMPFQDLVQEHGEDIPKWVRSVREETESSDDPASSNEASEEKLAALLSIAMACVSLAPENRPAMKDVLRMIREARAEAQVSSNGSSDQSPGRWSDTVQSLPRDEHISI